MRWESTSGPPTRSSVSHTAALTGFDKLPMRNTPPIHCNCMGNVLPVRPTMEARCSHLSCADDHQHQGLGGFGRGNMKEPDRGNKRGKQRGGDEWRLQLRITESTLAGGCGVIKIICSALFKSCAAVMSVCEEPVLTSQTLKRVRSSEPLSRSEELSACCLATSLP